MQSIAILLMTAALSGALPAAAEPPPNAFHWQQGQWFAYPLAYRTPRVADAYLPLVTSRAAVAEALEAAPGRTGYGPGGRYEPDRLTGTEATLAYAFHIGDLRPVDRDLYFKPDFVTDGPVLRANIVWASPNTPPVDAIRHFDVAAARLGAPAAPGEGRLQPYTDAPFDGDPNMMDHRIYEASGPLRAMLRCNIGDEDRGGRVLQPLCDGPVWDSTTNTVLYLTFPADLATAPGGWAEPATQALQLADSWRLDE